MLDVVLRWQFECKCQHFVALQQCRATKPQLFSFLSGLQSGENTLNVLCALRAAQTLVSSQFTDLSLPGARAAVLSDYVAFLTTPGTHNDTYAESFHRSFFADWQDQRPTSPSEVKAAPPVGGARFCIFILIYSFFVVVFLRFWSLQKRVPSGSWAVLTRMASWTPSDVWPPSFLFFCCQPRPPRSELCVSPLLNRPLFFGFFWQRRNQWPLNSCRFLQLWSLWSSLTPTQKFQRMLRFTAGPCTPSWAEPAFASRLSTLWGGSTSGTFARATAEGQPGTLRLSPPPQLLLASP